MEDKVKKSHDRGIDFLPMKQKLIDEYAKESKDFLEKNKYITRNGNNTLYLLIEMIQLRNGSRICEAICAFKKFLKADDLTLLIDVKIAKSVAKKRIVNKDATKLENLHKVITTPIRFRKMEFPLYWIKDIVDIDELLTKLQKTHQEMIDKETLRSNVAEYMIRHFNSNTHSLRYAFINYMIEDKKTSLNTIAKFIGHANVSQLVTYTQQKKSDKLFEDKI
jgi:hypothetical protein